MLATRQIRRWKLEEARMQWGRDVGDAVPTNSKEGTRPPTVLLKST